MSDVVFVFCERGLMMGFGAGKHMAAGTKVRVAEPMAVPTWSKWDDDRGRTSTSVKKRLQSLFFNGDRKVSAEVLYVSRESERVILRRQGLIKLRLREASGTSLTITADPATLVRSF
ncbi:MAG: hypothetical protein JSV03_03915 [Planctomycetota bacterium]|nr:MAG: hypothetical protein JSV03_03915 [Planctomycetota bacterium]